MQIQDAKPPFTTPSIAASSGFPRWHIVSSFIFHSVGLLFLWYLSLDFRLITVVNPVRTAVVSLQRNAVYLPPLTEAGNTGAEDEEKDRFSQASEGTGEPSHRNLMVYDGAQHVISNPPDADNSIQTLLQPDLKNPAKLTHPVPMQNVVKIAKPQSLISVLQPAPLALNIEQDVPLVLSASASASLIAVNPAVPLLELPKLPLPAQTSTPSAAVQKPIVHRSQVSNAVQTAQSAAPKNTSSGIPIHTQGVDDRNLLVINAVNTTLAHTNEQIPPGELHGGFEVSSVLPPEIPLTSAGMTMRVAQHRIGRAAGDFSPDPSNGSSVNHVSGSGSSKDDAANAKISASGSNAATERGSGADLKGRGMGAGMSIGNGNGPFPHITIEGRRPSINPSSDVQPLIQNTPLRRENYGMTIVSSASSGGGLRDFGVFRDGPVYTVYLNMASLGIRGPSWVLQYGAALNTRQAHHNASLVPPYVVDKMLPQLPSQLALAFAGRMMVVQAQINVEGKLESLRTLQSPNAQISALVEECLRKWLFQPAMMEDQAVPVKVLLGIPLAAAMGQMSVLP